MSGREREPVAAFFPSIDRNLIRDLDRHLRNNAPVPAEAPAPQPQGGALPVARPSTSDILEAVDHAAASMAGMHARIQELEARLYEIDTTNQQLKSKLGELLHNQHNLEASARADRERAEQAEQSAAQHHARVQVLENDLAAALGDLNRIADAITGALHVPD